MDEAEMQKFIFLYAFSVKTMKLRLPEYTLKSNNAKVLAVKNKNKTNTYITKSS